MNNAIIHTIETAPAASKPFLRGAQKAFGFIPNLLATLAESPAALESYLSVAGAFSKTSLSAAEQQVVLISVSIENGCYYCVAAHTFIARSSGVEEALLTDLRAGRPLSDAKLNALAAYSRAVVATRGYVSHTEEQAFLSAGYTNTNIFEVLVGVTQKTLSNYSNHITQLALDPQFADDAWAPPARAAE